MASARSRIVKRKSRVVLGGQTNQSRTRKIRQAIQVLIGIQVVIFMYTDSTSLFPESPRNESSEALLVLDKSFKTRDFCWNNDYDETQEDDPCTSPQSLTNFMKKQDASIFSMKHPVCPDSARNHLHIVIPFYNLDEGRLRKAIKSALNQRYPKELLHIWVYDDGSPESSVFDRVCCGGENVFEFSPFNNNNNDDKIYASSFVNTLELKAENIPSLLCFRSTQHLGPGGGKYWSFRLVHALAGPNDIVLILDGDDILFPEAAQVVNKNYIKNSAWFTYGSYEGKWSNQTQPLPIGVSNGLDEFNPRNDIWRYGHPRSFKAHLLNHIERIDFTQSNGNWLSKASDRGFVYKMLELSGTDRICYIPQKIYKYNYSPKTSTVAVVPKELQEEQTQHTQSLKPSSRLELPIHIVLLAWKRIWLLEHQLIWIQQQIDLHNRQINVHIVNNNWDQRDEVDDVVSNFTNWQVVNIKEKHDNWPSLSIKVEHISKDDLFHCFSRFLYVDNLRLSTPLDSIIFLDDDQYWTPNFISTLLKEHKPRGMTTWYGKVFERKKLKKYWWTKIFWSTKNNKQVIGNFWTNKLFYGDLVYGKKFENFPLFNYGGPGGSIIDVNLWTFRHQLLRLRWDLDKWSKIDDIWLSYVMDALLGWEIRRLRPPMIPIDVGNFHEDKNFRNNLMKNLISNSTGEELMKLKTIQSVKAVATFKDPSVKKQDMFEELQTAYKWDVFTYSLN